MIISAEDVKALGSVAINVDPSRITPYIEEVEKLIVMPALGAEKYRDIDNDRAEYHDLLHGCYYEGDGGIKYCRGLIVAVAYLAYSKYLLMADVSVTAFGAVRKRADFSEPLGEAVLIRAVKDAESSGREYLRQCVEYLGDKCSLKANSDIVLGRKFSAIGSKKM